MLSRAPLIDSWDDNERILIDVDGRCVIVLKNLPFPSNGHYPNFPFKCCLLKINARSLFLIFKYAMG
jgi:hypothetical protein